MKCPKCGYISFDHNDFCPKCKKNISDTRAKLNLPAFMANPISIIAHRNAGSASAASGAYDPRALSTGPLAVDSQGPAEVDLERDAVLGDEAAGLIIDLDDLTLKPDSLAGTSDKGRPGIMGIDNLATEVSEIDLAIESLEEADLEPLHEVRGPSAGSMTGAEVNRQGPEIKSTGKELSLDLEDLDLDLDLEGGKKK